MLRAALQQARERGLVGRELYGLAATRPRSCCTAAPAPTSAARRRRCSSSLNGYRGQPTTKPPFPAVSGAFERPTLLNNVETLATVPTILRLGAEKYAELGTEQSERHARAVALGPRRAPGQLRAADVGHAGRT